MAKNLISTTVLLNIYPRYATNRTKKATAGAEHARKHNDVSHRLSAEDGLNKGRAFHLAEKYQQAIEAFSRAIEVAGFVCGMSPAA